MTTREFKCGLIANLLIVFLARAAFPASPPVSQRTSDGSRIVDGVRFTQDSAGIQAAIDSIGPNGHGKVYLPPGVYAINAPVEIRAPAIAIECAGFGSVLMLSVSDDLFRIGNQFFELRNCAIGSTGPKTAGALFRVGASLGTVQNVSIGGDFYDGFVFVVDNSSSFAHSWSLSGIRVIGGPYHWNSFISTLATTGTIADLTVHNLLLGAGIRWTEASLILDTGTDSFHCTNCSVGPVIVRNTLGTIAPEWTRFVNSFCEAGTPSGYGTGTCLNILAARDFRYQGYIGTSLVGAYVGGSTRGVELSHVEFVNIRHEAVVVAGGAKNVRLSDNTFENVGYESSNSVTVEGATDGLIVVANAFTTSYPSAPLYNLFFGTPVTRVVIANNLFGGYSVSASNSTLPPGNIEK